MGVRKTNSHVPKLPILTTEPRTATFSFLKLYNAATRCSKTTKALGKTEVRRVVRTSRTGGSNREPLEKTQRHLGITYRKHGVCTSAVCTFASCMLWLLILTAFTVAKNTKYDVVNSLTPLFLSLMAVLLKTRMVVSFRQWRSHLISSRVHLVVVTYCRILNVNHSLRQCDSEEEHYDVLTEDRLRPADRSSRGVLPNVVRHCVWSRNPVNEEALAHWKLSRQKQTNRRPNTGQQDSTETWRTVLHLLTTADIWRTFSFIRRIVQDHLRVIHIFFFFRRHNFNLWMFWPSQHIISKYYDPGCSSSSSLFSISSYNFLCHLPICSLVSVVVFLTSVSTYILFYHSLFWHSM
jgi:hypothetical protein